MVEVYFTKGEMRRRDAEDIASGRRTREEVQKENSFLPGEAIRSAIWSLGNEAGRGLNLDVCFAAVKKLDPTRPVHGEGFVHGGDRTIAVKTSVTAHGKRIALPGSGDVFVRVAACCGGRVQGSSGATLSQHDAQRER